MGTSVGGTHLQFEVLKLRRNEVRVRAPSSSSESFGTVTPVQKGSVRSFPKGCLRVDSYNFPHC